MGRPQSPAADRANSAVSTKVPQPVAPMLAPIGTSLASISRKLAPIGRNLVPIG
jgi:hypothetical protein